jgi:hypothetical protein
VSDIVVCLEMTAWLSAVSEGGQNILRMEARTSPIGCSLVN